MSAHVHLAGIIPVANLKTEFDLKFPAYMLPVATDFSAIQKAVFECAMAGCQTIWIVANDDEAPILRECVGEWVYDPVYYGRLGRYPSEARKEIPIYYVPIHPKDRDRRDSYGWSVLYGINSAWRLSKMMSQWLIPDKYFVTFPMNAYNPYCLRNFRAKISDFENNFFLTSAGANIKDGVPLPFTMFGEDFITCRRHVNSLTTKEFEKPPAGEKYPQKKLPLLERWSARYFGLETVFSKVNNTNAITEELDWYYNISTWEGYGNFMGSDNFIKSPPRELTLPRKHAILGYTLEGNSEQTKD